MSPMPRPADGVALGGDDCLAPQPLTESVSPALVGSCTPPTQPQHPHSNIHHASVEATNHKVVHHDPLARPADHVTPCVGADAQIPPATPPTAETTSVVAQHPGAVVGHTAVVAASTTTASTTTKIRQANLAAAIRSRVYNGSLRLFWHCA